MKKILLIIALFFSVNLIYAQVEDIPLFSGKVFMSQTGSGAGYWEVSGTFQDQSGYDDASGIQVGHILFFTDAGIGYHLPVTVVVSTTDPSFTVRVNNTGITGVVGVPTGEGVFYEKTANDLVPFVSGITDPNQQTLLQYSTQKVQEALDTKLSNILPNGTVFIGNASNIATSRTLSGDLTTTNTGVVTVDKIDNTQIVATGAANGQTLVWSTTNSQWEPTTPSSGVTDLTITGTSSPLTINSSTGTDVTVTSGTGISLTGTSGNITINNTGIITEVDGSTTNELQTVANTSDGTTHTATLSNSGGSLQLAEGAGITLTTTGTGLNGIVTIASTASGTTNLTVGGTSSPLTLESSSGADITVTAGTGISLTGTSTNMTINNTGIITEVDGNISNEGHLSLSSGTATTTIINSNSSGSTPITVNAGTGLSISENTGTNNITLTNSAPDQTVSITNGGGVAVSGTYPAFTLTATDQSTTNELQTVAGTSNATSHTTTLSNSGGSLQLVEGSNVTLTTSGTGLDAIVTIASTGGTTDLTISGTSSPLTLNSSSGTDVTLTAGTGISLSGTSGNATITNTGIITEVDGSVTNEGSLTVGAGAGNTSLINSNTTGSTAVTITAGTGLTIAESGNIITLTNDEPDQIVSLTGGGITGITGTYPSFTITSTEVDGSVTNELQTVANTSDATSHTATLSNSGGSIQLVEGSNITLTTTGTSGDGVVTIAATPALPTLANNNIWVGNASNVATAVNPSGDADISNTGVITVDRIDNIDVQATGATDLQLMRWNNTSNKWEPTNERTQQISLTGTTNPEIDLSGNDGSASGGGTILVTGQRGVIVNNNSGVMDILLPTGTTGQVLKYNGTNWIGDTDLTGSGATDLTFTGASSPFSLNSSTGTDVTFAAGSGITLSRATNELTVTATDVSATNELQTIANTSDATSHTATLSNSGGSLQLVEGTGISLTTSGTGLDGIATIAATTNLDFTGTSSPVTLRSSNGTDVTFTAGANISLAGSGTDLIINAIPNAYTTIQEEGSSLSPQSTLNFVGTTATASDGGTKTNVTFDIDVNALASTSTTGLYAVTGSGSSATRTITAGTGISVNNGNGVSGNPTITNTDPDQSTTNELQTIANTSNATTHTATLSNSGGSLQLAEGSGITLTTSGTGLDGIVTIASTSTGVTDLSFSGGSSPYTLHSSTGTDVTFAQGVGLTFTRTDNELSIDADDISPSNEGSLSVGSGTSTTSLIQSNTTGSTSVTLEALSTSGLTLAESGSTITLTMIKVLREETFTATASQTAFTMAYSAPAVSGTAYPLRVFRNGVELNWVASAPSGTQYTYSGTTLTTAANTLNDVIRVNYFN